MCEEADDSRVRRRHVLALLGIAPVAAACGAVGDATAEPTPEGSPSATGSSSPRPVAGPDMAVDAPGPFEPPILSSDVLVFSQDTLADDVLARIRDIGEVDRVEPMSMGSFFVDDRQVTYAAVDVASFRNFTQAGTAQTQEVWDRVAGGEICVEPRLGRRLQDDEGNLRIGNEEDARTIHIGAFAALLPATSARRIDAIVNTRWAEELGMPRTNAALLAMGTPAPQKIRKQLTRIAGDLASVLILGPDLDLDAAQTAVLVGGSVAQAVGSFSYTANPDGTVNPDPAWVSANITTMEMPIIGPVTGHRVMLPQLRAALRDVVSAGLSEAIYTYDGCYVPRFIARNPARGLSFHTFGTAIDLNARDNYRGIAGKMDRTVVAIFKRWGFAWGGDWNYTDPMHFELARLVKAG
ncbi:M15 family metallopeptidase [Nocardioides aequoreus]|uniref:M15 family metallopeptidase n=1 Tax=Nocardioides aequoreus TaxID=397278 RepID=UPI00068B7B63|nr:M15 family metallopeptidase [Nocardioides aequoreus]